MGGGGGGGVSWGSEEPGRDVCSEGGTGFPTLYRAEAGFHILEMKRRSEP